MKVYAIKDKSSDYEFAITDVKFEKKKLCESIDEKGNLLGCERAGCYSLNNPITEKDFCKQNRQWLLVALAESFKEHNKNTFSSIEDYKDNCEDLYYDVINEEFAKYENEMHTLSPYITFWNGFRYQSIVLDEINGIGELKIVSNETQCDILNDLDDAYIIDQDGQTIVYRGKKYEFIENHSDFLWEKYLVKKIKQEQNNGQ